MESGKGFIVSPCFDIGEIDLGAEINGQHVEHLESVEQSRWLKQQEGAS